MINERLLEEAKERFYNEIKYIGVYNIADLQKAVLTGCNAVTGEQHDMAQSIVDGYIKSKSSDVSYSIGYMLAAFNYGSTEMLKIVRKEQEKVRMRMLVKAEALEKASKLISACQQLMTTANNFNNEAQEVLSKHGYCKTKIASDWNDLKQRFSRLGNQINKVFLNMEGEKCIAWGDQAEDIEVAVREIMKIDTFENFKL